MALVATLGAADANSYVTVEEADDYFAAGVHLRASVWNALDPDDEDVPTKSALLITATRQIDRLRFWGCKADDLQALQFPRHGNCWDPLEIPRELKEAVFEQALSMAPHVSSGGQSSRDKLQAAGVQSYSVGELSETFAASRINLSATGSAESQLCQETRILLAGFVRRTGQVLGGRRIS